MAGSTRIFVIFISYLYRRNPCPYCFAFASLKNTRVVPLDPDTAFLAAASGVFAEIRVSVSLNVFDNTIKLLLPSHALTQALYSTVFL